MINIVGIYYEFGCGIKMLEIFFGIFMLGKVFVVRCGVNVLFVL